MGHTPGPWRVDDEFDVWSEDDEVTDGLVANVYSIHGNYTDEDKETQLANANLIATAPELLVVCEAALLNLFAIANSRKASIGSMQNTYTPQLSVKSVDKLIKQLQQAIAKTKGKEL